MKWQFLDTFSTSFQDTYSNMQTYFPFVRSLPPNATAAQVQEAARALNANRFEEDFCTWFCPTNSRGRGVRTLQELSDRAAEFLLDLFILVRQNLGGSSKIPKGHRKFQV